MTTSVHPTAVIDPSAELDRGVKVGAHAVIGPRVEIGADSEIGPGAFIEGPTRMGRENRVFSAACIGFEPQDLKFTGEESWLEIGDGNHFREFCTVQRGTAHGGGITRIGDNNLFMVYTHIAHDCQVGSRSVFVNNATLAGHVTVHDDATIGAFSSVHQFCRIGRHGYIGGYSVITRDTLPFVKTVGMKPSCYGVNRIGLERKGFSPETLKHLSSAYRILVRSRLKTSNAVGLLREEHGDVPEVLELIEFVESSQRGVIMDLPGNKGARGGSDG